MVDGNIEKIKSKIIGCRITKDVLEEVSKVIEEEYQESKSTDKYSKGNYSFKVRQREREYTTDNRSNFLSNTTLRHDLMEVDVHLYSSNTDVTVRLLLSTTMFDSYIEVTSNNLTKLNGINGRLETIFSEPKTKTRNYLFHSRRSWLISYLIILPLMAFNPLFSQNSLSEKLVSVLVWSLGPSFLLKYFFTWLFPKIETEYIIQLKIRKAVLFAIVTIGLTLLGNNVWMYMPH